MLIAFSGFQGSGKDSCAEVLVQEYGFTKIAFADAVREAALAIDPIVVYQEHIATNLSSVVNEIGWDRAKREIHEVRRILQRVGTEAGRNLLGENIWIDLLFSRYPDMAKSDTRYVITDCRFQNEVHFVQARRGTLVWVQRPGVESDGHSSESRSIADFADYTIDNDSSIEDLREDVRFLAHIKGVAIV